MAAIITVIICAVCLCVINITFVIAIIERRVIEAVNTDLHSQLVH